VQTGKMADLVLLRANPLVNIANTRSIVAVVADGQYFSPQRLASLRQQLKAEAAKR
jgi:imidazolonepropionase-like amidohydrolase